MIEFYVYPDMEKKRKHRVKVIVCDTRREMHAEMREIGGGPVARDGMAYCVGSVTTTDKGRKTPTFAHIFFNRVDLNDASDHSLDTITHECIHAAFRYSERIQRHSSTEDGEEEVCYSAGSMTGQLHAMLTLNKVRH